ncbi:MAG: alpha/beta hydrolase [Actinomycetota bacterium]|nr:alpha/beta hydrolase [Actinomycetota bacterium]
MTFSPAPVDTQPYDEFALFAELATEMGLPSSSVPVGRRVRHTLASGQSLSCLQWGAGEPELVFLHGGGQNAHTWDAVVLLLGRPALAIDLPGHGHSDRRADRDYGPWSNAEAVAEIIAERAPTAKAVVGMSLGGASNIRLAATRHDVVRAAVIIDVTPQVNDPTRPWTPEQRGSVALISGPPTYESYEAMAGAAVSMSPNRAPDAVRRGVRHNSLRRDDGKWIWRYDLFRGADEPDQTSEWRDFTTLWDDIEAIAAPTMLVVGGASVYVQPSDIDEFRRRLPSVRVEHVADAGHAVQSDQPAALVALLEDFVDA